MGRCTDDPAEGRETFEKTGSMEPSKSSLDRLPKQLSEVWEANREEHEAALRDALVVREDAVSVAVSIDGALAPIDGGNRPAAVRDAAAREGRISKGAGTTKTVTATKNCASSSATGQWCRAASFARWITRVNSILVPSASGAAPPTSASIGIGWTTPASRQPGSRSALVSSRPPARRSSRSASTERDVLGARCASHPQRPELGPERPLRRSLGMLAAHYQTEIHILANVIPFTPTSPRKVRRP